MFAGQSVTNALAPLQQDSPIRCEGEITLKGTPWQTYSNFYLYWH